VALNWKTVTSEHVREALRQVLASRTINRASGLVIIEGDRAVSAKEVLRVAYRIANKLPADQAIKFSSGDGTLNILRNLGFSAARVAAK
jgi:cell division GTPase FtsZ